MHNAYATPSTRGADAAPVLRGDSSLDCRFIPTNPMEATLPCPAHLPPARLTLAEARRIVTDPQVGADLSDLLGAAELGRMGVSGSIRGRVEDLGGTVSWTTRPGGGCVVRMAVPRSAKERR